MAKIVKHSVWEKVKSMPEKRAKLKFERKFTEVEMEKLKRGVIPESQEDKWFILYEDNILYFYRAWSGYCIYMIKFQKKGNEYNVLEALANRDKQQYEMDDETDNKILISMINRLLQ
ncbi:MAG TPA: hypothetical protein VMV49_04565 [Candidatus Deferrimicrobium sp.]|nr:hypothetical protein [Candidatus Deferrimicrobium sp.]